MNATLQREVAVKLLRSENADEHGPPAKHTDHRIDHGPDKGHHRPGKGGPHG